MKSDNQNIYRAAARRRGSYAAARPDSARAKLLNDSGPQLLYEAFGVLDRYSAKLGNRDPVKSLDEDQNELLQRVRAALEPLIKGAARPTDVVNLAKRIDAVLNADSNAVRRDVAEMIPRESSP